MGEWDSRGLHRMGYEGHTNGTPWRILPSNETPTSHIDTALKQLIFERAGKLTGTHPDQVRDIVSQAEERHWSERGWTEGHSVDRDAKTVDGTATLRGHLHRRAGRWF